MADWPSSLPQYVVRSGFSYSLSPSYVSSAMSTGYDKRRRKYSGQYATYNISMDMTIQQYKDFQQFFENNLGLGVVELVFPDPLYINDTITTKIQTTGNPYSVSPRGSSAEWVTVSFVLERLVTGYLQVAHDTWPLTLPQKPLHTSYSNTVQSGVVSDSVDTYAITESRRRFNAVTRYHSVSYYMTKEELEIFFNFHASLGYGSIAFTAPFPLDETRTMKARFDLASNYTVSYYGETQGFQVDFILQELPPIQEVTV